MNEEEIQIVISADTSELEESLDKTVKNTEKKINKMSSELEDSFKGLLSQVDKLRKGLNFNTSNGVGGLNKQLNDLQKTAKTVADGIQDKLNKAFNVKGKVQVSQEVTETESNTSSVDGLGKSLLTANAIGSQLAKSLAIDKPLQQLSKLLQFLNNVSKVLQGINKNKIKIFEDNEFEVGTFTYGIYEYQQALIKARLENVKFGQTIDLLHGRLDDIITILDETELGVDDVNWAIDELEQVMKNMGLGKGIWAKGDYESFMKLKQAIDETTVSANKFYQSHSYSTPLDKSIVANLKQIVQGFANATTGAGKLKMQLTNVRDSISDFGSSAIFKFENVLKRLNSGELPKAYTNIKGLGKGIKQAFQDYLKNSQQHLETMIKKINEWRTKHTQATKEVVQSNKKASGSFKSLLQSILPIASIYGVFNAIKTSVTSFANSLNNSAKFANVFGQNTEEMTNWLDDLDDKINMNRSSVMNFSETLFRMGRNLGMGETEAMGMSKAMSELAMDLQAYTGQENALENVASALRGEYDSIQSMGYSLSASAVEAKALAMGLDATSESALVLARQTLLLEQSGDILGYASANTKTLSGQMAMLRENVNKLATAFGSMFGGLLSACLPVLNAMVSAITRAVQAIADALNSIFALFGFKVTGGGGGGNNAIADSFTGVADSLDSAGSGAGKVADDLADGAKSAEKIAGLMGIDELNVLSSDKGGSGGGSGSSGGSGAGGGGIGSIGDLGIENTTNQIADAMTGELTKVQQAFLAVFERIKAGFMLFKDEIISEWTKLKLNIDKLGQSMSDFFVSCWKNGLDDTALIFGALIGTIVNTTLEIANSVVQVATGLFDHLNPNNNKNTNKFIKSLNNLLKQIQGFIKDAGKWFGQFASACQPFINNLGDIAMIVGGTLAQVLADAIQLVRDFMDSWAGQATIEGIAGALEWLSGVLEEMLGFVQDHITFFEALALGIAGAYGAFKLINGAIAIWNGLVLVFNSIGAICAGVATALGSAIAWICTPVGATVAIIGALIAIGVLLYKNWDTVKEYAKIAWDGIKSAIDVACKAIKAVIDFYINTWKAILSTCWNVIKSVASTAWNGIKVAIEAVFKAIKAVFDFYVNTWKTIISTCWNAIKSTTSTLWNGIKTVISNVFNSIKTTVSTIVNAIKTTIVNTFNTVKTSVANVFNGIKSGIVNAFNSAKSSVSNIVSGISNSIKNGFNGAKNTVSSVFNSMKNSISSVMNSAKSIVSGAVSKIKGFFNFKWSLPKPKIPKFTAKWSTVFGVKIPTGFNISWHKKGGIFNQPTLLGNGTHGVGEAGAEAVLPLSEFYRKEDERFNKLAQQIAQSNNGTTTVVVTLDGKVVAQSTVKNMKEMSQLGQIDMSWL